MVARARRQALWFVLRSYGHMSVGRGVKWIGKYEFGTLVHRRHWKVPR